MARFRQTRRELLKSAAAISAAASFAKFGITPSWSAEGGNKDALRRRRSALYASRRRQGSSRRGRRGGDERGHLYEGAFGKRDLGKGTDMTLDSVFWIASMTKAMTATAAMQLVEQGKLQLDEPIGKVLPDWQRRRCWRGLTTRANRSCGRPSGR